MVKHVGLKRGAFFNQKYVVRGVFIDTEGVKRFCLHDVEAAPNFDKPEVTIERDVELGAAFHTAGMTLTDKELVVDLAAAKKEQNRASLLANPATAEVLAREAAEPAGPSGTRTGRHIQPQTRVATSDTEEEDDDDEKEAEMMLRHEEMEEYTERIRGAGEGTPSPHADEEEAKETHLPQHFTAAPPAPLPAVLPELTILGAGHSCSRAPGTTIRSWRTCRRS